MVKFQKSLKIFTEETYALWIEARKRFVAENPMEKGTQEEILNVALSAYLEKGKC